MTTREKLFLPSWAKWRRFNVFPWKILVHFLLLVLTTSQVCCLCHYIITLHCITCVQIVVLNYELSDNYLAVQTSWLKFFYPADYGFDEYDAIHAQHCTVIQRLAGHGQPCTRWRIPSMQLNMLSAITLISGTSQWIYIDSLKTMLAVFVACFVSTFHLFDVHIAGAASHDSEAIQAVGRPRFFTHRHIND